MISSSPLIRRHYSPYKNKYLTKETGALHICAVRPAVLHIIFLLFLSSKQDVAQHSAQNGSGEYSELCLYEMGGIDKGKSGYEHRHGETDGCKEAYADKSAGGHRGRHARKFEACQQEYGGHNADWFSYEQTEHHADAVNDLPGL